MSKKKTKKVYDEETGEVMEVNQSDEAIVLDALLHAFLRTYTPCTDEQEADEVFTMGRLREFLQAFTMPGTPDALPYYLQRLGENGFNVGTSYAGDPAIFVQYTCKTANDLLSLS